MGNMRDDPTFEGPTASAALVGTLVGPDQRTEFREKWAQVLDALDVMNARGWRVISGYNWTVTLEESGEINVRVTPDATPEPS